MNPEKENEEPQEHRRADFASKKGEVVLRKHEYDGIQEFDQKLPNWWLITFFGAILFYLVYWFVYYQAGWITSDQKSVTAAMTEIQKKKAADLKATLAKLDDKTLVNEWATDPSIVASGEEFYNLKCIGCHGAKLDADIGVPTKIALSLVDNEWKYGDRPMEIFNLIHDGSPADSTGMAGTGAKMVPWGLDNDAVNIAEVVAFIISKNPDDFSRFKE